MSLTEKYQIEVQTEVSDNELWEQYYKTRDISIRNKIIEKYIYLVKIIALKFRSLYQQYGDVEDIINEGIIALMDVVEKYDVTKNTKFETYASIRIKGSIIDYVRKQDWIPRKVKSDYKNVKDAEDILFNKLGRDPKDREVADYLKIDINDYNDIVRNAYGTALLSFEELLGEASIRENVTLNPYNLPEQEIENKELHKVLANGINNLNEKEKLIISLYYKEEIKLKEIAEIMKISNSRASQIHTKALEKLSREVENYLKGY